MAKRSGLAEVQATEECCPSVLAAPLGDVRAQELAKGFVELWGLPSKIAADRDRKASAVVK